MMDHKNKAEELEGILSESRKFRDECKKNILTSKKLCEKSRYLIEEIHNTLEEHVVLLEENILRKEEVLAILNITNKENALDIFSPIFISVKEEKEIIREMYDELLDVQIPKENLKLLKLRQNFLELPFHHINGPTIGSGQAK